MAEADREGRKQGGAGIWRRADGNRDVASRTVPANAVALGAAGRGRCELIGPGRRIKLQLAVGWRWTDDASLAADEVLNLEVE